MNRFGNKDASGIGDSLQSRSDIYSISKNIIIFKYNFANVDMIWLKEDPHFKSLQNEPHYKQLLINVGF